MLSVCKTTIGILICIILLDVTFIFADENRPASLTKNPPKTTEHFKKIDKQLSALEEKVVQVEIENQELKRFSEQLDQKLVSVYDILSQSMKKQLTDYLALWVPILIAFAAIYLTARQMRKTGEHNQRLMEETQKFNRWQIEETEKINRISVRPDLISTKRFSTFEGEMGLFIENNGLGPGIIDELTLYLNDQPTLIKSPKDIFTFFQPFGFEKFSPKIECPQPGYALPAKERIGIFVIDPNVLHKKNVDERGHLDQNAYNDDIKSILITFSSTNLGIKYRSLYGDRLTHNDPSTSTPNIS